MSNPKPAPTAAEAEAAFHELVEYVANSSESTDSLAFDAMCRLLCLPRVGAQTHFAASPEFLAAYTDAAIEAWSETDEYVA